MFDSKTPYSIVSLWIIRFILPLRFAHLQPAHMDGSTVLGNPSVNPTVVNTQNNFIQINQLKITQEELKQLKPEQLQKVEHLLKQVVSN